MFAQTHNSYSKIAFNQKTKNREMYEEKNARHCCLWSIESASELGFQNRYQLSLSSFSQLPHTIRLYLLLLHNAKCSKMANALKLKRVVYQLFIRTLTFFCSVRAFAYGESSITSCMCIFFACRWYMIYELVALSSAIPVAISIHWLFVMIWCANRKRCD